MDFHSADSCLDFDSRIRLSASQYPQKVAIAGNNFQLTWADLDLTLNRIANAMIHLGVKPTECVG